jgi:hypothetical protein
MRYLPPRVELSPGERSTLEHWLRCTTVPNGLAQRVRVVLRYVDRHGIRQIARELCLARNTVRLWLHRFVQKRLEGFDDLPRSGRPVVFSPSRGHTLGQTGLRAAG